MYLVLLEIQVYVSSGQSIFLPAGWAVAQSRSSSCWGASTAQQPGESPASSAGPVIAPYVRLQFECYSILYFLHLVLHLNYFSVLFLLL